MPPTNPSNNSKHKGTPIGVDDTKREDKKKSSSDSAHWLDHIQTSPKDFLKHKFSYQYGMDGGE